MDCQIRLVREADIHFIYLSSSYFPVVGSPNFYYHLTTIEGNDLRRYAKYLLFSALNEFFAHFAKPCRTSQTEAL